MDKLLVLDYLQTKLNQAQKDIELFSLMIQEIEELAKDKKKLKLNNNFLQVITNNTKQ